MAAWATGCIAARYGLRPQPFYLGVISRRSDLRSPFSRLAKPMRMRRLGRPGQATSGTLAPRMFRRTTLTDRNLSSATRRAREQSERWYCVGHVPTHLRSGRPRTWTDRCSRRALSGRLGGRATGHRRVVRSGRSEMAHRRWHVGSGHRDCRHRHVGHLRRLCDRRIALGLGTAMVYPTLLASIGDVAHPSWRASAVGVYRLWRDFGYAVGALIAGVVADLFGLSNAALGRCSADLPVRRYCGRSNDRNSWPLAVQAAVAKARVRSKKEKTGSSFHCSRSPATSDVTLW